MLQSILSLFKKPILWIIIALLIAGILSLLYFSTLRGRLPFFNQKKGSQTTQDEAIKRQEAELENLKTVSGYKEPTKEQIEKQAKELDKLRKEAGAKEPTKEEINAQMEELNKLKN